MAKHRLAQALLIAADENNLVLSQIQQQKLLQYLDLLIDWNRVFNLTHITEPHEMVYLHLIDSLILHSYLHGKRMLDVGSGGGLPGIPLAIFNPDQEWTLLDKNGKKTRFLTQVIAELGLSNVHIIHHRCENFHPEHCFDTILARAFGTIRLFVESTEHLLCPSGLLIMMKGKYPQNELDEIPQRFSVDNVTPLNIKGMNVERHLVCLRREK